MDTMLNCQENISFPSHPIVVVVVVVVVLGGGGGVCAVLVSNIFLLGKVYCLSAAVNKNSIQTDTENTDPFAVIQKATVCCIANLTGGC